MRRKTEKSSISILASLYMRLNKTKRATYYHAIASQIASMIPEVFMDRRGMLKASTEKSQQGDVWSTALAVYLDAMPQPAQLKAAKALTIAYHEGTLSHKGNIRHVLTSDDFSEKTAWEHSLSSKNKYQNGSYWGTPTGWVAYAMALVDEGAAMALAKAYIDDLRETDFRKGVGYGGPYECFHPETGDLRNPVYLTSVASPFAVFKKFELPPVNFQKVKLYDGFIAEGVAVADVNKDGQEDILAGSYWFKAPKWKALKIREPITFEPDKEWSDAFLHFSGDIDKDGWQDFIRIGLPGKEAVWYMNPKGKDKNWEASLIDSMVCNESPPIL